MNFASNIFRAAAIACMASIASVSLVAQEKPKVAILEPAEKVEKGKKPRLDSMLKDGIWGALEEALVASGKYRLLDRSAVALAQQEMQSQRNLDVYDQDGIQEFAKRQAADTICATTITLDDKGKNITVQVRIINVATGELLSSGAIDPTGVKKPAEVTYAVKLLAKRLVAQASK